MQRKRGSVSLRINAICAGLIERLMSDQMVAAGQGKAQKALLNSVPMGRYGRPEEMRAWCYSCAMKPRAT